MDLMLPAGIASSQQQGVHFSLLDQKQQLLIEGLSAPGVHIHSFLPRSLSITDIL
jgi:hypothetical protein